MLVEGKMFCKRHQPVKKKRPIRPSHQTKGPLTRVQLNAIEANRRTTARANERNYAALKEKRNKKMHDLITGYVEGATGVLHLAISYPGFVLKTGTEEEKLSLMAIWYLLPKYTTYKSKHLAERYHRIKKEVDEYRAKAKALVKSKAPEHARFNSIIEDVLFQIRMQKIRANRKKRS